VILLLLCLCCALRESGCIMDVLWMSPNTDMLTYYSLPEYKHSYYSNLRNNGVGKRHLYPSFYTIHQLSTHPPTPLFLSLSIEMLIL
jgi:hypothetical protein